jgi:hypothetical protein
LFCQLHYFQRDFAGRQSRVKLSHYCHHSNPAST